MRRRGGPKTHLPDPGTGYWVPTTRRITARPRHYTEYGGRSGAERSAGRRLQTSRFPSVPVVRDLEDVLLTTAHSPATARRASATAVVAAGRRGAGGAAGSLCRASWSLRGARGSE